MAHTVKLKSLFSSLLAGFLVASCATVDLATERAEDKAAALAVAYLNGVGASGLTITVGVDQSIVWSGGFGFADLEQQVPVNPALTLFRVGSTAKPMTAMALGQLVEAGKLDLDEPVQTYLPDFPEKRWTITTRMLAGHLAGIRHYKDDEFYSAVAYESVSDALSIFKDDPLEFRPGTAYSYSSYGFNLVSAVVEAAADQEFLSYLSDKVFTPTGMTQTIADRVVPIIRNRSRYYRSQDGVLVNTPWVDNSNKWAGGGILSTSEDLVRFGFAHLSDQFLRPETIELMWSAQSTSDGEKTGYGIGWQTGTDKQGRRVVGHTGGSVGGTTSLRIYPQEGMVVAIISNTSDVDLGKLTDGIVEVFLYNE